MTVVKPPSRAIAPPKRFKIGEVAAFSGLPIKTIRYYEDIGLLSPTVERAESGYRLFNDQVFNRLAFIRRSQALGLSLQEIIDLLQVHDHGELPCDEVKTRLEAKVEAIAQQITALETLKAELQGVLDVWEEQPSEHQRQQTICPNIQKSQGTQPIKRGRD